MWCFRAADSLEDSTWKLGIIITEFCNIYFRTKLGYNISTRSIILCQGANRNIAKKRKRQTKTFSGFALFCPRNVGKMDHFRRQYYEMKCRFHLKEWLVSAIFRRLFPVSRKYRIDLEWAIRSFGVYFFDAVWLCPFRRYLTLPLDIVISEKRVFGRWFLGNCVILDIKCVFASFVFGVSQKFLGISGNFWGFGLVFGDFEMFLGISPILKKED
jgi:hypothetical protein